METEALKEPYHDGSHEDDGESTLEEVARLLPKEHHSGTGGRHTIVWQLHNEWYRLASEGGMLEHERHDYSAHYAKEIQPYHHQSGFSWEEDGAEEGIDRQFGGAGHKRCQHDC